MRPRAPRPGSPAMDGSPGPGARSARLTPRHERKSALCSDFLFPRLFPSAHDPPQDACARAHFSGSRRGRLPCWPLDPTLGLHSRMNASALAALGAWVPQHSGHSRGPQAVPLLREVSIEFARGFE